MKKIFGILISVILCLSLVLACGCGLVEREKTDDEERDAIYELIQDKVDLKADKNFKGKLKILYQSIPSETTIIDAILEAFHE